MTGQHETPSDDPTFDAAFSFEAEKAAGRYGFATRSNRSLRSSPGQRLMRSEYRSTAALKLVLDIQQSLLDDNPDVSRQARIGLNAILFRLHQGDIDEHRGSARRSLSDRVLQRILGKPDPDAPEPRWQRPAVQNRVRSAIILMTFVLAVGTTLFIALQHPVIGVGLLLLTGLSDISEGAFGRVVRQCNPTLKWVSGVSSQVGDMLILSSIAILQAKVGDLHLSGLMFLAMLVSLLGAFVRVSALQTGRRAWVSRRERRVRYVAVTAYCVLEVCGASAHGAITAALLICGVGLYEVYHVSRGVLSGPHAQSVGLLVVDTLNGVHEYRLVDSSDDYDEKGQDYAASPRSSNPSSARNFVEVGGRG